jgi:hypothetical protein
MEDTPFAASCGFVPDPIMFDVSDHPKAAREKKKRGSSHLEQEASVNPWTDPVGIRLRMPADLVPHQGDTTILKGPTQYVNNTNRGL